MIMSMLAALMNQGKYGTSYDGKVFTYGKLNLTKSQKKMMRAIMKMSNSRFSFHAQGCPLIPTRQAHDTKKLDHTGHQVPCDVFSNGRILTNIHDAKRYLVLHFNLRKALVTQKGEL